VSKGCLATLKKENEKIKEKKGISKLNNQTAFLAKRSKKKILFRDLQKSQ